MRIRFSLDELQVFCAVCEAGTLSRGAESVALSMSAVSAKMKGLEEAFGQSLFGRSNRGILLTPAGIRLRKHAQELLQKTQIVADDMTGARSVGTQLIRLGVGNASGIEPLIFRLGMFLQEYKNIDVVITAQSEAGVVRQLNDGRIDLALCASSTAEQGHRLFKAGREKLALIVSKQHIWARQTAISFTETLHADYICLPEENPLQEDLHRRAEQCGGQLRGRIQVAGFEAIAALVATGAGVAVVPEQIAQRLKASAQIAAVPLSDSWADKTLSLSVLEHRHFSESVYHLIHALADEPALAAAEAGAEPLQLRRPGPPPIPLSRQLRHLAA
jgi:DNA-binding transcriptional LysR family regulator